MFSVKCPPQFTSNNESISSCFKCILRRNISFKCNVIRIYESQTAWMIIYQTWTCIHLYPWIFCHFLQQYQFSIFVDDSWFSTFLVSIVSLDIVNIGFSKKENNKCQRKWRNDCRKMVLQGIGVFCNRFFPE